MENQSIVVQQTENIETSGKNHNKPAQSKGRGGYKKDC